MAKRLTYIQNYDGNRGWVLEPFTDEDHKSGDYIFLCQHSDGNATELDIVKIPRHLWDKLVNEVNEKMKDFK
jgi:hypothetical protein